MNLPFSAKVLLALYLANPGAFLPCVLTISIASSFQSFSENKVNSEVTWRTDPVDEVTTMRLTDVLNIKDDMYRHMN